MVRKLVKLIACLAVLAMVIVAVPYLWVEFSTTDRIVTRENLPDVRTGLVLGTSKRVRDGRPNLYFDWRMDLAANLINSGKLDYLIVSGNQQDGGRAKGGYDEPTDMRDALVKRGVPAAKIYRDYAGFRTLDSILRAKSVFGQDKVLIISQQFHIERALFLSNAHGYDFYGIAAQGPEFPLGLKTAVREIGARVWAVVDLIRDRGARHQGDHVVLGRDPAT